MAKSGKCTQAFMNISKPLLVGKQSGEQVRILTYSALFLAHVLCDGSQIAPGKLAAHSLPNVWIRTSRPHGSEFLVKFCLEHLHG